MIPILVVFLLIVIPYIATGLIGGSLVLTALYWVLFLMYIYIFIRMGIKFWRLRERFR